MSRHCLKPIIVGLSALSVPWSVGIGFAFAKSIPLGLGLLLGYVVYDIVYSVVYWQLMERLK